MKAPKFIQYTILLKVFLLFHSCASQKTDNYFQKEYDTFYNDCIISSEKYFHISYDEALNSCKILGDYLPQFSRYSKRAIDSLKYEKATDYLIFQRITTRDRKTCSFVYNQKTEKAGSIRCSRFNDRILNEGIEDWNNFREKGEKPKGHAIYYIISKNSKKFEIVKM